MAIGGGSRGTRSWRRNSPHRSPAAVTAGGPGGAAPPEPQVKPKPRPPSHYLWAALIARIYEVLPLICPHCGGRMRISAFITFSGGPTRRRPSRWTNAAISAPLERAAVDSERCPASPRRPTQASHGPEKVQRGIAFNRSPLIGTADFSDLPRIRNSLHYTCLPAKNLERQDNRECCRFRPNIDRIAVRGDPFDFSRSFDFPLTPCKHQGEDLRLNVFAPAQTCTSIQATLFAYSLATST